MFKLAYSKFIKICYRQVRQDCLTSLQNLPDKFVKFDRQVCQICQIDLSNLQGNFFSKYPGKFVQFVKFTRQFCFLSSQANLSNLSNLPDKFVE